MGDTKCAHPCVPPDSWSGWQRLAKHLVDLHPWNKFKQVSRSSAMGTKSFRLHYHYCHVQMNTIEKITGWRYVKPCQIRSLASLTYLKSAYSHQYQRQSRMLQRCVNGTNCSRDRKRGHMSFVVRAQLPAQNFCLELFVFFFFLGKLEFSPAKVAPQLRSVSFSQSSHVLLCSSRSVFLFRYAYLQRRRHDQHRGQCSGLHQSP
jgi:hypothetical protein